MDLRSCGPTPLSPGIELLFAFFALSGMVGSLWSLAALLRGRIGSGEVRAWLVAVGAGGVAAWVMTTIPSNSREEAYGGGFLAMSFVVAVSMAGLTPMMRADEDRRRLGQAVYRSASLASLAWFSLALAAR